MSNTFIQLAKFGIVGVLATLVHIGIYTFLASSGAFAPLMANVLAFIPAFVISFSGHLFWTFSCEIIDKRSTIIKMIKFFITALFGLGLNSFWVFLVTDLLSLEYYYANVLFLVATPLSTFVISKNAVFNEN